MLFVDPPMTRARYCVEVQSLVNVYARPICIRGPILGTFEDLLLYVGGRTVHYKPNAFVVDDTLVSVCPDGLVLSRVDVSN